MTDSRVLDEAVAAIRRHGAVTLVGGRGSGRTTVLSELGARFGRRGDVVRVRGRLGFVDQPLAAFGRLDGGLDEVVTRLVRGRPLVLVDDPHLLHDRDLAVLADAHTRGARLALAATTETTVPPQLATLLGELPRVALPPLDEDALTALTSSLLDDRHVDAVDVAALAAATGGRPGLVRRVLDGAGVTVIGDLTVLPHRLGATPGAIAWRRHRVSDPRQHRACRLAAGTPQMSAEEVATSVGADVVQEVLDAGLAHVDDGHLVIRDPLLDTVLREVDSRIHASEDATAVLDAIGDRLDTDRRRRLQVEAGAAVAPDERAAVVVDLLAHGDPRAALRAAAGPGDTPRLSFARARAHAAAGQVDEAAAAATRVVEAPCSDPDQSARSLRAHAGILLGDLLWFRRSDAAGALRVLERVGDDVEAAAIADLLRMAIGETPVVTQHGAREDMVPLARQLVELRAVLAGAVADPNELAPIPDDPHPSGVPVRQRARTNRVIAALYGPGVAAATPLVERQVAAAVASGRPGALALALSGRWEVERYAGRLVDAERTLRAARARAQVDDEAGLRDLLAASHASVLAELGRLEESEATLPPPQHPDLRVRLGGAAARVRLLASHDRAAAVDAARAGIEEGLGTGHVVWAVELALHAARAGLADEVAATVAEHRDARAAAAAAAAAAVCSWTTGATDAQRRSAAHRLAAVGRRRVAAELLLSSSSATPADRRRAAALMEGLGPPHPDVATPVETLTDRERQVAALAADGRTSRDVADALGISVRTVDNHLRRVYRKLGVDGREHLALVLRG